MCVCVCLVYMWAKKTHAYNMYIYIYTHPSVCIHMAFGVREALLKRELRTAQELPKPGSCIRAITPGCGFKVWVQGLGDRVWGLGFRGRSGLQFKA